MLNKSQRVRAYNLPAPNRPRTKPTPLGPIAPEPVRSPGLELRKKLMQAYAQPSTKTPQK